MNISNIPLSKKIEFLKRLKSGKFTLKSTKEYQKPKTFNRLDNGSYRCQETGETLSHDEVEELASGYDICIELTHDLNEPATGYSFANIGYPDDSLDPYLIPKE